uniref:Uncharacterized protein n=1 Tax=Meloidogyne enterolobii TaxID=390850 RepID=A0A6V7XXA7_MELEN|nr:unnamed protein product [Meloidogyne enterolobii]
MFWLLRQLRVQLLLLFRQIMVFLLQCFKFWIFGKIDGMREKFFWFHRLIDCTSSNLFYFHRLHVHNKK